MIHIFQGFYRFNCFYINIFWQNLFDKCRSTHRLRKAYAVPWAANCFLARRHLNKMFLTNFENLNSISNISQETHDFLGDCNWTRTHNHLLYKRTLKYLAKLAKWLSCVVSTYLYGAFDCMFLSCDVRINVLMREVTIVLFTRRSINIAQIFVRSLNPL